MEKSCFAVCFFVFASSALAGFDIASLQRKFRKPATNNGPHCYNTTLVALGYMDEIVHVTEGKQAFTFLLFANCKIFQPPMRRTA